MFDAQYLFEADPVYTPWIPRQGDNIRLSAEVVDLNGTGSKLDVFAYTKGLDDTRNGVVVTQPRLTINAAGVGTVEWTGMNELVRFRLANGATPPDSGAYVLCRVLPPVWFDAVEATI